MRILYWCPFFWPEVGGVETISAQLLSALSERGHEFLVIAARGRDDLPDVSEYQGVKIYRFPVIEAINNKNPGQILSIGRHINALKDQFKPDVIHLHLGWGVAGAIAYFYLQTTKTINVPTLATLHNCLTVTDIGIHTILGQCLRRANSIVPGSKAMYQDLLSIAPELASRSSLLVNCLPLPANKPTPLNFDKPRLLCFGRLVKEKGFDLAVDAFALLAERHPQLSLVIVGDGLVRRSLEEQVKRLGLNSRITFSGNQPWAAMSDLLNQATLVIVPSRWREPFGLVALEAAQMGRPVVATHVGGLSEIVIHGKTGLLVDAESPEGLAEGIDYLLGNPKIAQQMGDAARQLALQQFDWKNYVDAYDALYHKLIVQHRHEHT